MVYIIEDEPVIREILSLFIESFGYPTKTFPSGDHFLEHMQEDTFQLPRMIFSDIRMPGITGLDMIQTFKNQHPHIPCCIMTAYDNTHAQKHPIYDTLHCVIPKPFTMEHIQDALDILTTNKSSVLSPQV